MLEIPLGGGTSDAPVRSEITIEFALTAEPRGDANANKLQVTDAVKEATETVSALRPTPQIVGQMDSAISAGTKVATELQTFGEVLLGGGPSDVPVHTGTMTKPALNAEPRGDVNANELRVADVVESAVEAVSAFRPTPHIVVQVDSAIGTGTQVATQLQTFENTWSVLLTRMALFNKIVGGIAEVSGFQLLAPSPPECRIDSPIHVVGLVCDIGREPGLCVARCPHQR